MKDKLPGKLGTLWLLIHAVIIINLLIQIFYGAWMVFVEVRPEGVSGPLFGAANSIPVEMMMVRRAYAIETWIAIGALSIYLGITEILPRRLRPLDT